MSAGHSPFAKISQIEPIQRSPYFVAGEYLLRVVKTTIGNSQQGKGPFWAAEFEIVASNAPSRPAGSKVGWPMYFSKGDVVLANIKSFLSAALPCAQDDVTPEVCERVTSGDGTLMAGRHVRCSANDLTTRAGNVFTALSWTQVPEESLAEVTAQISGLVPRSLPQPVPEVNGSPDPLAAIMG